MTQHAAAVLICYDPVASQCEHVLMTRRSVICRSSSSEVFPSSAIKPDKAIKFVQCHAGACMQPMYSMQRLAANAPARTGRNRLPTGLRPQVRWQRSFCPCSALLYASCSGCAERALAEVASDNATAHICGQVKAPVSAPRPRVPATWKTHFA
jgi:hypothetical protein